MVGNRITPKGDRAPAFGTLPLGHQDPLVAPASHLALELAKIDLVESSKRPYRLADALGVAILTGCDPDFITGLYHGAIESIGAELRYGEENLEKSWAAEYLGRTLLLGEGRGVIDPVAVNQFLQRHTFPIEDLVRRHGIESGNGDRSVESQGVGKLAQQFAEVLAKTGDRSNIQLAYGLGLRLLRAGFESEAVAALRLVAKALKEDNRAEVVIIDAISPLVRASDVLEGARKLAHMSVVCLGEESSCAVLINQYNERIKDSLVLLPSIGTKVEPLFSAYFNYVQAVSTGEMPDRLVVNLDAIVKAAKELSTAPGNVSETVNDILRLAARITSPQKPELYDLAALHAERIPDEALRDEVIVDTERERLIRMQNAGGAQGAIEKLQGPDDRMRAKHRLAFAAACVNQYGEALKLLTADIDLTRAVTSELRFLDEFAMVGVHFANGNREEAARSLTHSLELLNAAEDSDIRGHWLGQLANSIREGARARRKSALLRDL